MSGWYKNADIDKAINDVESIFNSLNEKDRQQAWYWISFDRDVEENSEENSNEKSGSCYDEIDDEMIKWMLNRPEKFKRHMEIYERSIVVSKERAIKAEKHVERMRKFEQEYKQKT